MLFFVFFFFVLLCWSPLMPRTTNTTHDHLAFQWLPLFYITEKHEHLYWFISDLTELKKIFKLSKYSIFPLSSKIPDFYALIIIWGTVGYSCFWKRVSSSDKNGFDMHGNVEKGAKYNESKRYTFELFNQTEYLKCNWKIWQNYLYNFVEQLI